MIRNADPLGIQRELTYAWDPEVSLIDFIFTFEVCQKNDSIINSVDKQ